MANEAGIALGIAIVMAGMSLTACNKQGEGDILAADSSADDRRVEDRFGMEFGKSFRADRNSEPTNVSEKSVPPRSHTEEPVQLD